MWNKLKYWYYKYIKKQGIIIGYDSGNAKDFSCTVYGYRDKNDVIHITKTEYK